MNYLIKMLNNFSSQWTSYVLVALLLVFVLMVMFMVIEFFKVTKDPIEIGRLIIDYLKAVLSWPVIIFALLYIFITKFEKEIKELLKSLEEVGGEKVSAKFKRRAAKKIKKKGTQIQPVVKKIRAEDIQKQILFKPNDVARQVKELMESDYKKAIEIYEKLKSAIFGKEVHEAMAYNYHMEGKLEEAIGELKALLVIDPNDYRAYYRWGLDLDDLGKYEEAILKYQKAIEINPKYDDAYTSWGIALSNLGRREEAIEKYKKAIEINPKDADIYYNWGVDLIDLGRYEQAIQKFQKTLGISPMYEEAYVNWGWALDILGKYEEAIEKYQKASVIDPKDSLAYYNQACAYSMLKQNEEALKYLKKAIELDEKSKEMAKTDPEFDNIRNDPEFKKLVAD